MKFFLIIIIIMFSFSSFAYAYPESNMQDCISRSLNNPATKSRSKKSIKNYCDCALKSIIDEKKDIRKAGYECAMKNFN